MFDILLIVVVFLFIRSVLGVANINRTSEEFTRKWRLNKDYDTFNNLVTKRRYRHMQSCSQVQVLKMSIDNLIIDHPQPHEVCIVHSYYVRGRKSKEGLFIGFDKEEDICKTGSSAAHYVREVVVSMLRQRAYGEIQPEMITCDTQICESEFGFSVRMAFSAGRKRIGMSCEIFITPKK